MTAAPTDFWRGRPTLVTGGTGLVGGWLVKRLLECDADVVCVIRDWVPQSNLIVSGVVDRVRIVRGDVRDQQLMERALGEYEIDTVIHLAAQAIVGIGNRNPISTFETNIRGTWVTLEACRRSTLVRQIVIASSDKAYGYHEDLPYDETKELRGRHPYDVSKSCADLIAQAYAATYGLPVAITRCGNFYGGGDLNWNRIVPGTIRSALKGERPVIRSDGNSIREFLYVENAVSAYMTLAEGLSRTPQLRGEAFNFGHQKPWTVSQLVQEILRICGREDLEPDIRADATNEIVKQYLDPRKAMTVLGWQPRFTLTEGLERTVAWYADFLKAQGSV
jgi:CDP-glucose 4,6-dehydratase